MPPALTHLPPSILTPSIDGNGKGGKMVICGDCGAKVRGYIENPNACEGEDVDVKTNRYRTILLQQR